MSRSLSIRPGTDPLAEPEYSSMMWCMSQALTICAPHVLTHPEYKKLLLQSMILLLTGQGAKCTEPALFMQMLHILEKWLLQPDPEQGSLSPKEAVLFLQRMASLERYGLIDAPMRNLWDKTLLGLLHSLCTHPSLAQDLKDEVRRRKRLGYNT